LLVINLASNPGEGIDFRLWLGALGKLRDVIISFVFSVRVAFGFHWTDFHEIRYLSIFKKIFPKRLKFH